jgi:hypothetical protein
VLLDLDAEVQRQVAEWRTRIEQLQGEHVAIEALWDGDTEGWFLDVALVSRTDDRIIARPRGSLRYGSDSRVFQGRVPPWPESTIARAAGSEVARALGLEFYFPSPDQPDDECPHFWQRDGAAACRQCGKPLVRHRSPHLRPDLCHPCQLEDEHRRHLIADTAGSPGNAAVHFFVVENGRPTHRLFVNLGHSRVLVEQLDAVLRARNPPLELSPRLTTTLAPDEVRLLHGDDHQRAFFDGCGGREVEVAGNGGVTHRDVSFLCYAAARGGTITVAMLVAAFPFLSADAIEHTLAKLEQRGLLVRQGANVCLTARGFVIKVAGP